MVFAFKSLPLKTLYVAYFLCSVLVRLPVWIVTSAIPSMRGRRSWSFTSTLSLHVVRAILYMFWDIGVPAIPDPEKHAQTPDKFGFVWIEPVPDALVIPTIAAVAKTNNVRATRTSGYWFGKKDGTGKHGQRALEGERVLLFLHGGAYVSGSAEPKSPLTPIVIDTMAHSGGLIERALALEYRLSWAAPYQPANPFPAALFDALAAYHYLIHDLGFAPKNILLLGDSAGAHLGLNLVMYINEALLPDLPLPGGMLMLSPATDWARTHDHDPTSSMVRNRRSDYIHRLLACEYTGEALRGFLPKSELAANAYLSPSSLKLQYKRGFFGNLPPTCIIAGDAEVMLDSMRTLRDRLVADNDKETVVYHEYADAAHDWLYLGGLFATQKKAAYEDIKQWIISVYSGPT